MTKIYITLSSDSQSVLRLSLINDKLLKDIDITCIILTKLIIQDIEIGSV